MYLLLKERPGDILKLLEAAKQKDASIDPFVWSKVIGDVESFRLLPRMITPVDLKELVAFYRQLRRTILSHLKP